MVAIDTGTLIYFGIAVAVVVMIVLLLAVVHRRTSRINTSRPNTSRPKRDSSPEDDHILLGESDIRHAEKVLAARRKSMHKFSTPSLPGAGGRRAS